MKILILGHNGMLGNAAYKFFSKNYETTIIEESRWNTIEYKNKLLLSNAEVIINCVGAIPQKKYSKEYYGLLNVELPIFLETTGKKVIHPSTDCEFSGYITYPHEYDKTDVRDAYDDYGMSKAKISKIIEDTFINTKMIRTSIIGHEINGTFSLLDWFLGAGDTTNGFINHYWNGITTLYWCIIAEHILLNWESSEIITQVGVEKMNKFELLNIIKKVYENNIKINEFNTELSVNKLLKTDKLLPSIEQQLIDLKIFYNK